MRSLLLVLAFASVARADDLDPARTAVPTCDPQVAHCFAVRLHVATGEHGPVASAEWVTGQFAAANRHFIPLAVGFQLASVDALPDSDAHMDTREHRSALATGRELGKVIDVFVVAKLDDVDVPGKLAHGVTWRRGERKYVIVAADAFPRVLAHELGHFFGLPHSTYAISIMNKTARDEPPVEQRTFADEEIEAMRPVLKRLLRDGVIVEVTARS